MNIELLRKVQDAILLNPWAFDMHDWQGGSDTSPCGTTACIAGWAAIVSNGKRGPSKITYDQACAGAALLGDEYGKLTYQSEWPGEFDAAYGEARWHGNHEAAALIAAARIEVFIQSEGRE